MVIRNGASAPSVEPGLSTLTRKAKTEGANMDKQALLRLVKKYGDTIFDAGQSKPNSERK